MLRQVDKRIGLIDALAACLTDPRDPAKTRPDVRTLLAQRIFALALGYEDLNDHEHLRHDPLLQVLSEHSPQAQQPLASASTLCRWENRIKEQQLDLFAGRTSCHRFGANQFRLLLSSAAYVLVESLRRLGLAGTELAHAQAGTIRVKLLKIGGRIGWSARRIVLHLAAGYPL